MHPRLVRVTLSNITPMTTAYILVAIQLEERDLIKGLGQDYVDYRKRIPMILPFPKGKGTA